MPLYGDGKKGEIQFYQMYPVIIVCDRYDGTYSGGKFTVWGCAPEHIPEEVYSDDDTCHDFWKFEIQDFKYHYGIGNTIQEAVDDMYYKLENPMIEVKPSVWWNRKSLEDLIDLHEDHHGILKSDSFSTFEAEKALKKYDDAKEEFLKRKEAQDDDS